MEFVSVNKFTLLDYPEKVACVLYTQACNFQCPYCHNYETLVKGNVPGPKKGFVMIRTAKTSKGNKAPVELVNYAKEAPVEEVQSEEGQ